MNTKITTRIWEGSILIDKKVKYINLEFDVIIKKVLRGFRAVDNIDLIVEEADYITFIGDSKNCLKLLEKTTKGDKD